MEAPAVALDLLGVVHRLLAGRALGSAPPVRHLVRGKQKGVSHRLLSPKSRIVFEQTLWSTRAERQITPLTLSRESLKKESKISTLAIWGGGTSSNSTQALSSRLQKAAQKKRIISFLPGPRRFFIFPGSARSVSGRTTPPAPDRCCVSPLVWTRSTAVSQQPLPLVFLCCRERQQLGFPGPSAGSAGFSPPVATFQRLAVSEAAQRWNVRLQE